MFDEVFGEVIYDGGYVAKKKIEFLGSVYETEILIDAEEDEEISQKQRDVYKALMLGWDEIQKKTATAILKYYNEEEKGAYGPDESEEFEKWWPDIKNEEDISKNIHLDSIVIQSDYLMELDGENPVYLLFDRDWGGEDLEDNGVAVLIEDGEVSEVGYKYIAF